MNRQMRSFQYERYSLYNDELMKIAFDVAYNDNRIANAVGVSFQNWTDDQPTKIYRELVIGLEDYVPGEFYKRELPCILKLLSKINTANIEVILIDGYVFLDDMGTAGLGAHLYKFFNKKIPVIGVAKTPIGTVGSFFRAVTRGNSAQPLFITAAGLNVDEAASHVMQMHGEYRIPTLLKRLDRLSKM